MKKHIARFALIGSLLTTVSTACTEENTELTTCPTAPNTSLFNNQITITDILNIPSGVHFNQVKADISGEDWQVIHSLEAPYDGQQIVLSLPATLDSEQLQKVVRDKKYDYTGFWFASTSNKHARVAELKDIFAYQDDKRVGMIYLSDWPREGTTQGKSWISYHYTDQDYSLSAYVVSDPSDPNDNALGSYLYRDANFKAGWNAYAKTVLWEESAAEANLCTTAISGDKPLRWWFVAF